MSCGVHGKCDVHDKTVSFDGLLKGKAQPRNNLLSVSLHRQSMFVKNGHKRWTNQRQKLLCLRPARLRLHEVNQVGSLHITQKMSG